MINVKQLIEDPRYLAYKLDLSTEMVEFMPLVDNQLTESAWLNRDASRDASAFVPLAEVLKFISSQPVRANKPAKFIFHTAYCASTFLSRCLSVKGHSVSLREPQLLLDAANAKRLQWRSKTCHLDFRHLPALALRLLQKHSESNETLIIKPVNSVNNIIAELLQANGQHTKAVMLYTDARNFLLSTLKKGEEAKQRQRAMFDLLRCDFPHLSQLGLSDVLHLSDLKVCLTLWRLQLEQADQVLAALGPKGFIGSLYAETLIQKPEEALLMVNGFLELGINNEKLTEIANGDLTTQDAKNGHNPFSVSNRDAVYAKIEHFYGDDLINGYKWLTANNPSTSLMPTLSASIT